MPCPSCCPALPNAKLLVCGSQLNKLTDTDTAQQVNPEGLSMKVRLDVTSRGDTFSHEVELPAVPRQGDHIFVGMGKTAEKFIVREITWNLNESGTYVALWVKCGRLTLERDEMDPEFATSGLIGAKAASSC
jgi:hypothetical protein